MKLSFIVPIKVCKSRDVYEQAIGLSKNIAQYFDDYEIIYAEQVDDDVLKHGQLRNLAYQKSSGDILVFMDVDARFIYPIDIVGLMEKEKTPLLLFDKCYDVVEDEKQECGFSIYRDRPWCGAPVTWCHSRMVACTRKQFEDSGGFSNLCLGWGFEDTIFYNRLNPVRLVNTIGHMTHGEQQGPKQTVEENRYISDTDKDRDVTKDNWTHTVADEINCEGEKTSIIKHYGFANIRVADGFEYCDLIVNRRISE